VVTGSSLPFSQKFFVYREPDLLNLRLPSQGLLSSHHQETALRNIYI